MDCGVLNPLYPLYRALGYTVCSGTGTSRLAGRAREGEGVEGVAGNKKAPYQKAGAVTHLHKTHNIANPKNVIK